MHHSLQKIDHRPWRLPKGRWRWRQSWHDLLFAHWPMPKSSLEKLVPPELSIQEFDGTSWVGIVPFRMEGVMMRPLPNLPWVSAFPELNLRLYVELDGKAGVWFISLDAANSLAVWSARRFFHLPYFQAAMKVTSQGQQIRYSSLRKSYPKRVVFKGEYRPISDVFTAKPGTLEHFLTERYRLYTQGPDGRIFYADVHHQPWPLQKAEAVIEENTIAQSQGIPISGPPTLLHFSKQLDVIVWSLKPVIND